LDSCGVCHVFSGHTNTVQSLSIFRSSDGFKHILVSSSEDKSCKLWNLKPILENIELKTHEVNTPRPIDNSPSPKIRCDKWTFEKLEDDSYFAFEFHTAPLTYAEFSSSGKHIVSSSLNEIMVWDANNGQVLYKNSPDFSLPNSMYLTCHFGPEDGVSPLPYLLAAVGNQIILYSLLQNSLTAAVEGHHMNIVAVLIFSSTSFCTVSENEIGLWKIEMGESRPPPRRKSLSPRKSYPLTNFTNGTSNKAHTQTDSKPIDMKKSSGKGNYLLPPNDTNHFWSSENNNEEDVTGRKLSSATSDRYSPTTVGTVLDNGAYFVKVVREEILYKKPTALFQCAAVTQDRELLACGTSDRKIFLWNLETKQCLGEFSSHTG
jgi:WD40 repeat protein